MSKKTAPNKLARSWRRARNQAMMQALRAVATLEGHDISMWKADAHQVRHKLVAVGMDAGGINAVLYNAAREFEKAHPRGVPL